MTKGFITIATGKSIYKKLAHNLLTSYKLFTKNKYPFAIITDKKDEYTNAFDVEIILEKPHFSYLDKIEMLNLLPFDINIFLDADILAYSDLNILFDVFENADDFSCFGKVFYEGDSKKSGWFDYASLPQHFKKRTNYSVGLHGGGGII